MGNFHCIPSSCAKVVYREYLPPVVRWRYEEEDWQEIEADDYTVESEPPLFLGGQCPDTPYYCTIEFYNPRDRRWKAASTNSNPALGIYAPITGYELIPTFPGSTSSTVHAVGRNQNGDISKLGFIQDGVPIVYRGSSRNRRTATELRNFKVIFSIERQQDTGACGNPEGECTLTITKNGQIVHEETRDTCPEVEKLPCRLSNESKEIKIEKLSYLERVEIRNQSIDVIYVPPLNAPFINTQSLPDQCLNIYNTLVSAPPFLSDFVLLPGIINPYQFITQICSAPGCPPPEYQVICDCEDNCESCPDGTCAVNCDGHICCYDTSTGKAVKQIAIENYCGGIN